MKPAFAQTGELIKLPPPRFDSGYSIEKTLLERRSVRDYSDEPVSIEELAQLLWACQGFSSPSGKRTAPSAGALYPLEIYIVVQNVAGLSPGIYHYTPGLNIDEHRLEKIIEGDKSGDLAGAALGQDCIHKAAVSIVITAVVQRTAVKYGQRAEQYVYIETGHAAQNVCLQAQAFNLGVVTVGAFYEDKVQKVIGADAKPTYILCVGRKK